MPALPNGTVTFLFTDIEGSTKLWEDFPEPMRSALEQHDTLLRSVMESYGGHIFKTVGDAFCTTFATASQALAAALEAQIALQTQTWQVPITIQVRMALHSGSVEIRDNDYFGPPLNRVARLLAIGHGGQILLSQATLELIQDTLPPNAGLENKGEHRLKDLGRPETVYQLLHPALPATFPALRSLKADKHNLPRQLSSFIGREAQITEVKALLGQTCLLTLTGSGGSGKTRLALQIAAELIEEYTDGVWFVELTPLPDDSPSDTIAKAVATALRVKEQPGQEAQATLCEYLASKSLLLLLDNCEHLETTCVSFIHALLLACPNLRILATSRTQFGTPEERAWQVPSLPFPPKNATVPLSEALKYEAVRLFMERANAAHPAFRLTNATLPHVVQICRRLDGIPLAIELAAARVSMMEVKEIATRLDQAIRLLIGKNGLVERHRTLEAVIAWSYDRLKPAEQALLRRLAIFVGGWTLEACEDVCAWGEVEREEVVHLLARLVQTSLVARQEASTYPGSGNEAEEPLKEQSEKQLEEQLEEQPCRYYLLETLRQFGQEKLIEFHEAEQAGCEHLRYFLGVAEQAEPHLQRSDQKAWLARLEAEHDNLRAALKGAVNLRDDTRLRLACALWRFWLTRYITEGRSWLEGALNTGREAAGALRARALNGLGVLASRQGDYDTAARALKESLKIRRALKDERGAAETLNNLGYLAGERGDYAQAQTHYKQSLLLARRTGDRWGTAACLNNLGMMMSRQRANDQARTYYEESLAIYRQLNDAARIASASANVGLVALNQDDYAAAQPLFEESLVIFRQLRDRWNIEITLCNLGITASHLGKSEEARVFLTESLLLCDELEDREGTACAVTGLANVAAAQQRYSTAMQLHAAVAHLRDLYTLPPAAHDQVTVDQEIAAVRMYLSEAEFTAAWAAGTAMSYDEIFRFAQRGE